MFHFISMYTFPKLVLKMVIALLFCSQLHAFCVYNKLEGDRVRLSVMGPYTNAPPG